MSNSKAKHTRDNPVLEYFQWRVTDLSGYGYAEGDPGSHDVAHEAQEAIGLCRTGSYQWRRHDGEPWRPAEGEPGLTDNLAP